MAEAAIKPPLTPPQVLAAIPQQPPFRFVDEILELSATEVLAAVRFDPAMDFYRGHFPDFPVTPGVILTEALGQATVVALGIFISGQQPRSGESGELLTMLTESSMEFSRRVAPGERVLMYGKLRYFRRRKICVDAEMRTEAGERICAGVLSGMGVSV